ncbi:297_t:CDS:2, partial [Gigaspora rosea]
MALVLSETYQPVAKNNERNSTTTLIPSLLMIKTIMRLGKVKINKLKDDQHLEGLLISEGQSKKLGEVFGRAIWNVRSDIIKNKIVLESSESFDQYQYQICLKKQKQRNNKIEEFDNARSLKISAFIISIILTIAFPSINIWLTHLMSSVMKDVLKKSEKHTQYQQLDYLKETVFG